MATASDFFVAVNGLVDLLEVVVQGVINGSKVARQQAGISAGDKVLLVESPRPNVSSLSDLQYLIDVEGSESLVFNRDLYRRQYLRGLVEHRGQPMVLLPYHYFDGALDQ